MSKLDKQAKQLEKARSEITGRLREVMLLKTKRDAQKRIGPSEIGDPCELCLGRRMAERLPHPPRKEPDSFSLKGWVGSAVHGVMERDIDSMGWLDALTELTLEIEELSDYGMLKGHTDLLLGKAVIDHKTDEVANIRRNRKAQTVKQGYIVQLMFYGYAAIKAGHKIKYVGNWFIPRDNNSIDECWLFLTEYDPSIVPKYLKRAKRIWKEVKAGRTEMLPKDAGCYKCGYGRFVNRRIKIVDE